jgi:glutathione S-transferase
MNRPITLFHAPQSRSGAVRILLEELGAPYTLEVVNLKRNDTRAARYLEINPMGKVPALLHEQDEHRALVTEQPAILTYLADLYPQAGLAPALDDPLRGPYLRWMAFYGSSFEPAVIDLAMKREPAPPSMCPYGDYDTMLATLRPLAAGRALLGGRHPVGLCAGLDHRLPAGTRAARDHQLHGEAERPPGRAAGDGRGCRTGGGAVN